VRSRVGAGRSPIARLNAFCRWHRRSRLRLRPAIENATNYDEAHFTGRSWIVTTGISHIAIGVTDIERSLAFYRDTLGLQLTVDREEVSGPPRPKHRRACYLRWEQRPGAAYVVLGQQVEPAPHGEAKPIHAVGFHHVSFLTDDLPGLVEKVRAAGYEVWFSGSIHDGPANAEPADGHAVMTAMVYDPDHNIIQFDQWLTA
jgi:catechol 2,3-dioxygenase-like lactoylglutathione lyase family enzyme